MFSGYLRSALPTEDKAERRMKIDCIHTGALGVNTYFIINEASKQAIVLDPGGDADKILARAAKIGVTIVAILLTHAHFDHIGGCRALQDVGIPLFVHEKEEINLRTDGNMGTYFGYALAAIRADALFKDGDVLSLAGLSVRVIHTPGHTVGSCCFLIEGALFTGDTLFFESVGRTDLGGNARALSASLRMLFALEGDYPVYPGHGEETSLDYERENNPFC